MKWTNRPNTIRCHKLMTLCPIPGDFQTKSVIDKVKPQLLLYCYSIGLGASEEKREETRGLVGFARLGLDFPVDKVD